MGELIMWAGRTLSGEDRLGRWVTTSLEGWWDSPDTTGESQERVNGHGEYDLPVYNAARLITLSGNFHAKNHGDLHQAGSYLTGPLGGRFQVSGHGPTQWAEAKRARSTRFTPVTDTLAQWQVSLKAVDPRKYGDARDFVVTNGTVGTYHWGNTEAHPMVVVRGSAPGGYDISGPLGELYRVVAPLETGRPHRIDFNDGLIRVDGLFQSGKVHYADVWSIPPGQKTTFKVAPLTTGTAEITVTVTDTYT